MTPFFVFIGPRKNSTLALIARPKKKINKRNAGATFFSPERGARATSLQTTLEKLLPARSTTRPENRLLLCSVSNNHTDSNHRGLPPSTTTTTSSYLPSLQHSPPTQKRKDKKKGIASFQHTLRPYLSVYRTLSARFLCQTPPASPPLFFFFLFALL